MNIVRALRERKREGKRETEIKRKEKQEERERGKTDRSDQNKVYLNKFLKRMYHFTKTLT